MVRMVRVALLLTVSATAMGSNLGSDSVSADKAMEKLRQGNERFVSGKAKHPNQDKQTVHKLSEGQKPHTIILSCADSRVAPETVFDQGLGQVFVIRNAGHVPDHTAVASIEYAVEHLGSKLIVVMGHESCGAVKATLATPVGQSAGSPDLDYLVKQIRRFVAGMQMTPGDKKFRAAVQANANGAAKELVHHSEIIREAVDQKGLLIVEAVYNLDTGRVDFNEWNYNQSIANKSAPAKKTEEKSEHHAH